MWSGLIPLYLASIAQSSPPRLISTQPHASYRNGFPADAAGGAVRHAHDVLERGAGPVLFRVRARLQVVLRAVGCFGCVRADMGPAAGLLEAGQPGRVLQELR